MITCLTFLIILAVAVFLDWSIAQLLVWLGSQVFHYETSIWQVALVFVVMCVLESIFKSRGGNDKE